MKLEEAIKGLNQALAELEINADIQINAHASKNELTTETILAKALVIREESGHLHDIKTGVLHHPAFGTKSVHTDIEIAPNAVVTLYSKYV